MKSTKKFHCTNKTQCEIFNISQLSVQQINQALSNNPSLINSFDNNGETLLSYALKKNNYKIYDLLLNSPFLYLNYQDQEGNSYLHLAVKNQEQKIIKKLIEKGININLKNKKGNTALHLAYEIGNNLIIKFLLENGINRTIKNNDNKKAEEIKNSNTIFKTLKNNKSISEYRLVNKETYILKSSKKEDKKNICDIKNASKQENGGKYQENIKLNTFSKNNKNLKYIISHNNQEKKIFSTESNNNSNSTISKEDDKKYNEIKLDLEKIKLKKKFKILSLRDNNKVKDNNEEELFEYNKTIMDNKISYTDRGNKKCDINKKLNNLELSSFSLLDSSDSKDAKKLDCNKINSINDYDFPNLKDKNAPNTKKKNIKRKNYRNNFYNFNNLSEKENWKTIQFKRSPKKIKIKSKGRIKIDSKGSMPKKNRKNPSNKNINKTITTTGHKNKELFIIKQNDKNNQRYYNEDIDIDRPLNLEIEKMKRLEKKEYNQEEDNNLRIEMRNKNSNKNKIISINWINKPDENNLTLKSSKLLKEFLHQINMEKYLDILAINGFDDINLILEQSKNGGSSIQDSELKEAGITLPGDRAKILIRIQELSNNFSFPIPKEVYHKIEDINKIENDENIQKLKKWLENLKVDDYLINFLYSGYHSIELLLMQMISYNPLTTEVLKEEIGIDKIGYRSRIINKLKDEAKIFSLQLTNKVIIINKGEEKTNNCQCIIF